MLKLAKKFAQEKRGSVAAMFAVSIVPVMLSIGVAVDFSNIARLRAQTAQAADAAILAAAIAVRDQGLINGDGGPEHRRAVNAVLLEEFSAFFEVNSPNDLAYQFDGYDVDYDPATKESSVTVEHQYKPYFLGNFGPQKLDVVVQASVIVDAEAGGSVSMFLVLDKSGSMGWDNKMDSLKDAVARMSVQFEQSDPDHKYVRMGAIAYDTRTSRKQKIGWGTSPVDSYVQRLRAGGGTDSYKAVKTARKELRHNREVSEHNAKTGQDPKKVMVLMTDGANSSSSSDSNTKRYCDKAKQDNIEIYSVAFKAPAQGEQLLEYCASTTSHYFDADNSQELLAAFQAIGALVAEHISISK